MAAEIGHEEADLFRMNRSLWEYVGSRMEFSRNNRQAEKILCSRALVKMKKLWGTSLSWP
jgi:hypothetical protein